MKLNSLLEPHWQREHARPRFHGMPGEYHRAARRLGAGWRPSDVSRLLGCDPRLIHELLREPDFVQMFKGYRDLVHGDQADRLKHLVQMSMLLLEEAVFEGDKAVADFIKRENAEGRHPAETLAKKLLAGLQGEKRLAQLVADARDTNTEWPDPDPSPPRVRKPVDAATRRVYRATAKLRAGLVDEHGVRLAGDEAQGVAPRRGLGITMFILGAETAIHRFLPPIDIERETASWAWPEGP